MRNKVKSICFIFNRNRKERDMREIEIIVGIDK